MELVIAAIEVGGGSILIVGRVRGKEVQKEKP